MRAIKNSNNKNTSNIIDYGKSRQKNFQTQRHALSQQAQYSQRESNIRSHRYSKPLPARSTRRTNK